MQLRWASVSKMHQAVLLTLLLYSSLQAQENSFTINSIHMKSLPSWEIPNGYSVTLECLVDISTTSKVRSHHQVLFYKDEMLLFNISSTEYTESIFIPQARVFHSGRYKCTVVLNSKEKTTQEYQLLVKGVPSPTVTLDKKEVTEGGVVTVNCSVKEELPPIYFKIEKVELGTKLVKQIRDKTSNQNFVVMDFPIEEQDHVLVFRCQAGIMSGIQMQTSESTRSEYVTVQESFSTPKFLIHPSGVIIEGDQLYIKCTVQVTHLVREFPEIIIQKDKTIVATSKRNIEALYSVMATVENSGHYTCKVESNRISKVSSIMVNITELFPKPKLQFSSKEVDQGKILDLFCSVPGIPSVNFTIQKETMILSQDQNFSKIAEDRDSGMYSCTAGIGRVVKRSDPVHIKVCEMLSKPRIFHDAKAEIIKGHAITISCQSVNGTAPVTYHLIKDTNVFLDRMVTSNDPAAFTDEPIEDVEYQCMANNCHSHPQLYSETLRVKVIAPVDEVTISILSSNEVPSGNEIVLRCSVKEGTGPITFKFYKENDDRPFHETTLNDTQAFWVEKQASKKQEGQYYCTASNRASHSSSPRSNSLTVRVFLAPWVKGLIAVVVIGAVIAALIVAAKCYFLRKARAKQKPVEMSRPAAPLLNSNSEKVSEPNVEANSHYDPQNKDDVEYTEVQVSLPAPHQAWDPRPRHTTSINPI
ncbi:platelet endothelial cell adhesion molecule isoform X2 [Cricetulus griseus]|uniref:Platelet endothelial cell adhesion molecule n=1 Tax=Cricetulus griseus TaxID=10029 RepID=A0A9J7GER8_CRIGR|nr:platelet endothelial cell adhesion molecule isoform X2 [Cricetulus griseus]XP_027283606.1 platelet endothelial cell adhesion molecule isoform X2 [Cricetulus griseus]